MAIQKKVNYLSNKELLSEIHKSKNSYCYFIDDIYKDYDIMLNSKDEIFSNIEKAIQIKKEKNLKNNITNEVTKNDIVFRVFTSEHIPDLDKSTKEKKKKNKLNFDPYKHFIIVNDEIKEVGRSHWINGLENGEFSLNHGRITNKLALMIRKLVERYAQRTNWRSYTWINDMKGDAELQLIEVALKFREDKSDIPNPFSYYTQIVLNCFRAKVNDENKLRDIKDKMLIDSGFNASFSSQVDEYFDSID